MTPPEKSKSPENGESCFLTRAEAQQLHNVTAEAIHELASDVVLLALSIGFILQRINVSYEELDAWLAVKITEMKERGHHEYENN